MSPKYRGKSLSQIVFPLGGIGTGCIGLAGNGRLVDWEIFNRPNKESYNGFSHFAVKAVKNGELVDARILNGDLQAPYMGPISGRIYQRLWLWTDEIFYGGASAFSVSDV